MEEKIGPTVAEAAVRAQLNSVSYPSFFICSISIRPIPEASAIALPVMPENIKDAATLTWAVPPRIRPKKTIAESEELVGNLSFIHYIGHEYKERSCQHRIVGIHVTCEN